MTAVDSKRGNELSDEVNIALNEMATGKSKSNYLIKFAESSNVCLVLIIKQKSHWNTIEVEGEIVDTKEKHTIYNSCLLKEKGISVKFLNPILKKPL